VVATTADVGNDETRGRWLLKLLLLMLLMLLILLLMSIYR
jgi:hypothetical protein